MEVLLAVIGAAIVTALSYLGSRFITWWERHARLGHLADFIGDSKEVRIVLSSVPVLSDADEFMRAQPANVLFSPTAEGAAVARLYLKLHEAKRKRFHVELNPAKEFSETGNKAPFISVGGPSVNAVSAHLIEHHLPNFRIDYPRHEVFIGGHRFQAPEQRDGFLKEDYGFILSGRTDNGTPFAVVWGVYAFGSMVAARALIELSDRRKYRKSERSRLFSRDGLFLVAHGRVNDYQLADDIEPLRPQPNPWIH